MKIRFHFKTAYCASLVVLTLGTIPSYAQTQPSKKPATISLAANQSPSFSSWIRGLESISTSYSVITETSLALKRDPRNAIALRMRSNAYYSTSQNEKGKVDAEAAVKLLSQPSTPEEYESRCYCNRRINKVVQAVADCTIAIRLKSDFSKAYLTRASIYFDRELYDRALIDVNKVIEIDPTYAEAYRSRAVILHFKNDLEQAVADLSKAIELRPTNPEFYAFRGYSLKTKKSYDLAIADFTRAITIYPKYSFALYQRSMSHKLKNDFGRAVVDLSKFILLNPKEPDGYLERASIYWVFLHDNDKAVNDYTAIIRFNPKHTDAYYRRGVIYDVSLKDKEKALFDYGKVIELDPDFVEGYSLRAAIYQEKKEYGLAVRDLTAAIAYKPTNGVYRRRRADAYLDLKDYSSAIYDYSKAIEYDPEDASSYFGRAASYNNQATYESYNSAIEDYTKSIEICSRKDFKALLAGSYRERGRSYRNRGAFRIQNYSNSLWFALRDYGLAVDDYTKAISMEPQNSRGYGGRSVVYTLMGEEALAEADKKRSDELFAEEYRRQNPDK